MKAEIKRTIFPVIYFVIGIGCGALFFSKKTEPLKQSAAGDKNQSTLRSAIDGSPTGPASNRTLTQGNSASVESLAALVGSGHSPRALADLYLALDGAGLDTLLSLISEIDEKTSSEHNHLQLRNAVLARLVETDPDAAFDYATSVKGSFRNSTISTVINLTADQDQAKAIELLATIKDSSTFKFASSSLARLGGQENPQALLNLLRERKDSSIGNGYAAIYSNWARENFSAAATTTMALPPGEERAHAIQGLGNATSPEEITQAVALLDSFEDDSERSIFLNSALSRLSRSAPEEAIALIESHGDLRFRQFFSSIGGQWLGTEPEAAKTWIESLPPRDRMRVLASSTSHVLPEDHEWLVEQVMSLPPNHQTTSLASDIANNWSKSDPAAAAETIERLPSHTTDHWNRPTIVSNWVQTDARAAAEFYADKKIRQHNDANALGQIAAALATQSPAEALAWVESLEIQDKSHRSTVTTQLVETWAKSDPDAATTYAQSLTGDERIAATNTIATALAASNIDRAQAWADDLSDPSLRQNAKVAIINQLSYRDPEAAAAALDISMDQFTDDKAGDAQLSYSVTSVARNWAKTEPTAAAAWASDLPAGSDQRGKALSQIAGQWVEFEPAAASEWLSTLSSDPDRDSAVAGLVGRITSHDPEGALAWASTINNRSVRQSNIRGSLRAWFQEDRDAARAAMESADIDQEMRQELRQEFASP